MVALHRTVARREHRGGAAIGAAAACLTETVAGGQRDNGASGACRSAFAVGDAGHGPRRVFGGERAFAKLFGRRVATVIKVEIGGCPGHQHRFGGEPGIVVFGRVPRHRRGAFDNVVQHARIERRR